MDQRTTEVVEREKILGSGPRPTPKIVAWCSPAPVFTPVVEPLFMVHGLDGRDPNMMFSDDRVCKMADAISVHTKTLTVPDTFKKNNQENKIYESKSKIPSKNPEPERISEVHAGTF
jgi:hypothetical protein